MFIKIKLKSILTLMLLLASYQCASAQSYGPPHLVETSLKAFGRPVLSHDGTFIIFQSGDGLQKLDLPTGISEKITEGSGIYDIKISHDCKSVTWIRPSFEADNRRLISLEKADLLTKRLEIISSPQRHLSERKVPSQSVDAHIDRGHLIVNGKTIDPQGKGSYLWPSVSPDNKKVVYWLVGEGCYVSGIDGSAPRHLGGMRAAVWADEDNVIGMYDRDNGTMITDSRLVSVNIVTGEKEIITPEDMIALYPSACSRRVVFTDPAGKLYYIEKQ